MVAALAGLWAVSRLQERTASFEDGPTAAPAALLPLGLVLPMLAVGLLVRRLPLAIGHTSKGTWRMFTLSQGADDSHPCTLTLDGEAATIRSTETDRVVRIPLGSIVQAAADGEVLGISWRAAGAAAVATICVRPQRGERSSQWARALSAGLAASIAARATPAPGLTDS